MSPTFESARNDAKNSGPSLRIDMKLIYHRSGYVKASRHRLRTRNFRCYWDDLWLTPQEKLFLHREHPETIGALSSHLHQGADTSGDCDYRPAQPASQIDQDADVATNIQQINPTQHYVTKRCKLPGCNEATNLPRVAEQLFDISADFPSQWKHSVEMKRVAQEFLIV